MLGSPAGSLALTATGIDIHKSIKNHLFTDKERTLVNRLQFISKRLKGQVKRAGYKFKEPKSVKAEQVCYLVQAVWYKTILEKNYTPKVVQVLVSPFKDTSGPSMTYPAGRKQ